MLGISRPTSRGAVRYPPCADPYTLDLVDEAVGGARDAGRPIAGDSLAGRLRRAFRVVFVGIGVTALVSAAVFAYVFVKTRPDARRYTAAGDAARTAHAAMIDQETGVRGFLLSGQRQYLAPYLNGKDALRRAETTLVDEVGSDRGLARLAIDRRLAEQAWFDQWATPAVTGEQGGRDSPELAAFVARGKALFDAYRVKQARLIGVVDARRDTAISREGIALGVGAGLELVVLLVTALVARRQSRRLEAVVVPPVDDILGVIELVREGDLDARPTPQGPLELREIGAGLAAMTESLGEARAVSEARQTELREQAQRLDRVLTMSREVAGSLNLTYVLRAVGTSTLTLGPFTRVTVWLLDDAEGRLNATYDSQANSADGAPTDLELGRDLVGQAAKYGRTMTRGVDNVFRTTTQPGVAVSGIAVPMVVGARVIGVVKCFLDSPAEVAPMTVEVLETLASQAATAVEAARLHERTEELSQTDALTRLFNRRRLDADLESEVYRAHRYERPLSFIMIDIDHFKLFNDRFGHQRGDEALEMVAKVLADTARDSDTAYRFGGEELAVLCRETDVGGATELAERLRTAIERRMAPEGVTASFGVAGLTANGESADELVAAADRALYEAKHGGRNRVAIADSLGDQPVTTS